MAEIDNYNIRERAFKSLYEIISIPKTLPLYEIQIFTIHLPTVCNEINILKTFLSQEEKTRAEKFYFEKDYRLFVVTHGFLRKILGHYLGISPQKVFFLIQPKGKPILSTFHHNMPILFNISHSSEMAVIALTRTADIGVDVEKIQSFENLMEIAEYFFHPQEAQEIMNKSAGASLKKFYEIWTQKEAVVKALGIGLSAPLNQFRITGGSDGWKMPVWTMVQCKSPVYTRTFRWAEGYEGAIACKPIR